MFFWNKKRKHKKIPHVLNTDIPHKLLKLLAILLCVIFIHSLIIHHYDHLSMGDALWLSFTSITTVGYGDFSASSTEGRIATIVLIYLVGIWLLAQLAGDFLDYRADKREKMAKGQWRWDNMKNHILIINTPELEGDRYLIRLIEQIRMTPEVWSLPIEIITTAYPEGLSNRLRELKVVHFHTDLSDKSNLDDLNIKDARYVIILAKQENDTVSDSLTLDLLDRIHQYPHKPFIIAECVLDGNRERFLRLGANAVIRPVRAYPELIVRSMSAPGIERLLENLFTHHGASPQRIDIQLADMSWNRIVCKLINAGLGTALGYITASGTVITNPDYNEAVTASALLVMVNDNTEITSEKIQDVLR